MLAVKLAQKETVFTTICLASWYHKSSFVSEGMYGVVWYDLFLRECMVWYGMV